MENPSLPPYWQDYIHSLKNATNKHPDQIRYVVLDTETTGFNLRKDRILSIGALVLQNKEIKVNDAMEVFIDQETFDASTVKIHGILKNGKAKRITEIDGLKKLLKLLESSVLVAHHAFFDVGMINEALNRNGLPDLKNKTLDTALLYKKVAPKSEQTRKRFTLDFLADTFKISKADRHTALGDAYITALAFLRITNRIKPKYFKDLETKKRFIWF